MTPLNLPAFSIKLMRDSDGTQRVYDPLRARLLKLTPEEWVRQHFTNYLVEHKHYPASLLANEVSLQLNGCTRRCDTVLYSRKGLRPRLIVEYKAPHVGITEATFRQICAYNSVLQADYLIVTNGIDHYACYIDKLQHRIAYLPQIPDYAELIED